eukprot:CAMPEP_0201491422 /NCGR_PEP_ID=MMETSP0151_2-20130828/29773_1 /ASSEMBLY_ACC=CAM_ASM_000257 /TAXON_ID=200890 /ORGANISM="Paramoeba atlantica, Strain 621/1 / CCAP 1560/9" /LENGTH=165 /DNA_ID=CAMNT_0047877773 /DNA_START=51 /DNA_END=548 /DNA_ORIENTATION=-
MSRLWDPLQEFDELRRLFSNDLWSFPGLKGSPTSGIPGFYMASTSTNWAPQVDLIESSERFSLSADLPGVRKTDMQINASENQICVSGKRQWSAIQTEDEKDKSEANYLCRERRPGEFQRCFILPSKIKENEVEARLLDGVLEVVMEKQVSGDSWSSGMSPVKLQ